MNTKIEYRYTVYAISKKGAAKVDSRTSDSKSLYMLVTELKDSKVNGYVWDSSLNKIAEFF